ncbi:uncharacterized protein WM294_013936 isoform 2-T2 [Sarcoramphus papa]
MEAGTLQLCSSWQTCSDPVAPGDAAGNGSCSRMEMVRVLGAAALVGALRSDVRVENLNAVCSEVIFRSSPRQSSAFFINFYSSEEPGGGTGWQRIRVSLPSAAPGPVSEPLGFPRK